MHSVKHSIPRCVLAQSCLDSVHQSSNGVNYGHDHICTLYNEDRNTDLDKKYQEMVHANGLQRSHRHEGIADMMPSTANGGPMPGMPGNMHCPRTEDSLVNTQHYEQYRQQHQQQQQHQYLLSADRDLAPEYRHQNIQQHIQQSDQRHHRYSSPSPGAGAHEHRSNNGRRYHHYSHSEMSRLEAMFPPLHDSVRQDKQSNNSAKTPRVGVVEQMVHKSIMPPSVASRLSKQPRLLPPPILILKEAPLHQSAKETKITVTQQQLPSPARSTTSPESPSSLAIHLYVHHHHHHHAQEPPIKEITGSNTPTAPVVLLSPLTYPLASPLEPTLTAVPSNCASLPSPVSPTSEAIPPSAPLASPHPLMSLLPPLCIPTRAAINTPSQHNNASTIFPTTPTENDASTLPWFIHPNSLAGSNASQQQSSSTCALPTATRPSTGPNHPHRYRLPRLYPQLPDPVLAIQLLSTISSKDLTRLYAHAAHHLHSHQPIRRYVLMKMIMTQAELAQYGRLRAEMPRAPGPSTGAQPKRTGFGSEIHSGMAFRPKVPSKLGMYTITATAVERYQRLRFSSATLQPVEGAERNLQPSQQQQQEQEQERLSMLWTRSLPSLASLSNAVCKHRTVVSSTSSEPDLVYSKRRLEELELGESTDRMKTIRSGRGRRMQGSKDDGDVGEVASEDDDGDDDEEAREVEEEEEDGEGYSYWRLLRRKNNRNRRRLTRSVDSEKEQAMYMYQQQQQQQQHPYQKQQHPSFSSAMTSESTRQSHSIIIGKSTSAGKTKNARRRTGSSSCTSLPSSSISLHDTTELSSAVSGHDSSASFAESYGFSGLLMLSLFVFFLFLLEGTNQVHKLQSAVLSI
ncbi:hypothetical protein BGZ54_000373, partial [Gamsiella multidivaricata]